ncbi:MAG: single-stranded DNA-binding protein, partial [Bacilli bacterium]
EYETDFVDCVLWSGIATQTAEYCKKGDLIGVKGRLQTSTYEKDGKTQKSLQVVAEKITFLSSKQHEKSTDDMEV